MDRPLPQPGSVRRARERALAAQNVSSVPPPSGLGDLPPRRPPDAKTAPVPGPVNASHWPLPGPATPAGMESRWSQSHRDSLTLPIQVPNRRGPTTSDLSSLGEPLPSPFEGSPRQTVSSMGSIPDFPLPGGSYTFPAPPRKSALGPPPLSRRGMSSMYSSFSFVSPIPEESPRRGSPRPRSHESYASSAAIPETWGTGSPLPSPADSTSFFDDSVSDRSRDSTLEEFEDDINLFFEESPVNKKHVLPAPSEPPTGPIPPPPATLVPGNPFREGTQLRNTTTAPFVNPSSSIVSQATIPDGTSSITPNAILRAYAAGSLSESQSVAGGPLTSNRISHSQARRPEPRPADERGSITSLPDMIRRATTLATMMDKGTRPGSRVGEANPFTADPPTYSSGNEKSTTNVSMTESRDGDSSLSDMLAAFPPPAQTPPRELGSRESMTAREFWRSRSDYPPPPLSGTRSTSPFSPQQRSDVGKKRGRRCCGLPLWLFLLLVFLVICIIIVVIVVPVELLVVRKRDFKPDQNIDDCRKFLKCLNGGTNVVSPGSCSCICTNGFTGSDCSIADSQGCTSTNLVADNGKSRIDDVTIGGALPRLIVDSERTFAVPLSGAIIVGKVNGANLSCVGQNDLVRFNGQSMGVNAAAQIQAAEAGLFQAQAADAGPLKDEAADADSVRAEAVGAQQEVFPLVPTIIFIPDGRATIIIPLTTPGESRPTATPRITTRPNFTSRGGFTTRPTATRTRSFRPTATFLTSVRTTPLRSTIRTTSIFQTSIFQTSTSARTSPLITTTRTSPVFTTTTSVSTPTSTSTSASMTISVTVTTSSFSSLASPTPTNGFVVNDQVLEFSRVAVLYILQEENVEAAQTAQTSLGQFLNGPNPTVQEASDIDVGGRNRVNLDNFSVDVGQGPVGGKKASQPR
ncbi:Epidermal growth factor-like, type 3 [Ophiocordyceps camponoti-floridani]|uniref:Epidermal growth factor-like, type 3 n=1 Tax=Ophiocordyceps camponoti-floridani TaxID=2030778 RepID=A0A8H4VEA3_9HYPO|nr:Epidermal growth factor-like, type 3 [Ophiocordyceps camponoti-floridani]